jgi:hypothetical protein
MADIKIGERVRIKDRPDWPTPPGYRLANSEGIVTRIWEPEGNKIFQECIEVRIDKSQTELGFSTLTFRMENLEKI